MIHVGEYADIMSISGDIFSTVEGYHDSCARVPWFMWGNIMSASGFSM